jgi:hypothetical protein
LIPAKEERILAGGNLRLVWFYAAKLLGGSETFLGAVEICPDTN